MHTACIKLLLDRGIKQTASVTVDDGGNITVDTATQTILEYLRSLLNKISFLHSATQQQRRGWGGPSQVASSEACANEQTTRPRQDRTTQQTQAKRRRLNAVLSGQHSAQSQNGLIHRSQDVQSWTEGIVHGSDPANIHPEVLTNSHLDNSVQAPSQQPIITNQSVHQQVQQLQSHAMDQEIENSAQNLDLLARAAAYNNASTNSENHSGFSQYSQMPIEAISRIKPKRMIRDHV